jgi:hypothetical protein
MTNTNPEVVWDMLLSRNPGLIRKTWSSLAPDEQSSVLGHLIEMANKPGWMNQQQASAKIAINVIAEFKGEQENPKK